jgi:hypothetical protein
VDAFCHHVPAELIRYAFSALLKTLQVRRCPPVPQVSVRIQLRARIVKAVGDFMPDHRADSAMVVRIIPLWIEKRWLQNSSGKHDFIHLPEIKGVHRRGRNRPLHAVHRLAYFVQVRRLSNSVDRITFSAYGPRFTASPE